MTIDSVVPEPSSLVLASSAALICFTLAWRRKLTLTRAAAVSSGR